MERIAIAFILLAVLFLIRNWLQFPLFRLPGDIQIRREHFHFFMPITTCLLIGFLLSLIFSILSHFKK